MIKGNETVEKLIKVIEKSLSSGKFIFNQNEGNPQTYDIDKAFDSFDEQKLKKIKEIWLKGEAFDTFPESITKLRCLENLTIAGLTIKTLPESIQNLSGLKTLDLYSIESSQDLEGYRAIIKLPALEELNLSGEYNTKLALPDWLFQLTSLKILRLSNISELPNAVGNLIFLRELDLSSVKITDLPPDIGKLSRLEKLDLHWSGITKIPDSIGALSSLKILDLSGSHILSLPETIGNLSNLEELELRNSSIKKLPSSIGKLTSLKKLSFTNTPVNTIPHSMINLKFLAVNPIKNIKLVHRIQPIFRILSKHFNIIISFQKFMYSYMYKRLNTLQQKLNICGWHQERGFFICRRNFDRCCSTGGTCDYLGPKGCIVDSLSCKLWLCKKAMDYLDIIKSDKKHPLHKISLRYLRLRVSFDTTCHAFNIPLKGRASKFDNFDIHNGYRQNTYIENWFDNLYLRPFGDFISTQQAKTERKLPMY